MEDQDIHGALERVFHEVFDDATISIYPEMSAREIEQWDSFNHVRLIVAVEERFNVNFSTTEVAELKNVGELIVLIRIHLAGKSAD
jgi:acyl carrier protein